MKKEPRAIRKVERNAEKGKLLSLSQLIQDYEKGVINIDFDKHINSSANIINNSKFVLSDIKLENVKRLRSFDIKFHEKLTVIIGENAVGKTTICESIGKFLSWTAARIQKAKNGYSIRKEDVSNGTSTASIEGNILLDEDNSFTYQLLLSINSDRTSKYSEVNLVSYVIRKALENNNKIDLPVFAFYSIDRCKALKDTDTIRDDLRVEGYENALREQTDIANLEEWYIKTFNIQISKLMGNFKGIESDISDMTKNIDQLANKKDSEDIESLIEELMKKLEFMQDTAEKQMKIAERNLKKVHEAETEQIRNLDLSNEKIPKVINDTISKFISNFKSLEVDYPDGSPALFLNFDNYRINYKQLSHGQRSVINMLFDLIRRVAILNPHMQDPRKSKGVVIIDEIELHLHPSWQQQIINNLCECFPNIQFIITTHSPMILQSKFIEKENICILKESDEGKIIATTPDSQGLSVNDILLDVFKLSVVEDSDLSQKIRLLKSKISEGTHNDAEGNELLRQLEKSFGINSNVMKEIQSLIEFQSFFS